MNWDERTVNRFFLCLAVIPLLVLTYYSLTGMLFLQDDWRLNNFPIDWNTQMVLLAFGLALFPYVMRTAWAFLFSSGWGLLRFMFVVAIIGFLAALSIPNFRKAREQKGGFATGGAKDINTFTPLGNSNRDWQRNSYIWSLQ